MLPLRTRSRAVFTCTSGGLSNPSERKKLEVVIGSIGSLELGPILSVAPMESGFKRDSDANGASQAARQKPQIGAILLQPKPAPPPSKTIITPFMEGRLRIVAV